jgi:hypothetical protein
MYGEVKREYMSRSSETRGIRWGERKMSKSGEAECDIWGKSISGRGKFYSG